MSHKPLLLLMLGVISGFLILGGVHEVHSIRVDQEKNARIREINANVRQGIELANKVLR